MTTVGKFLFNASAILVGVVLAVGIIAGGVWWLLAQ